MEIHQLTLTTNTQNPKVETALSHLQNLVLILNEKKLQHNVVLQINFEIDEINRSVLVGNPLFNLIKKKQSNIIKLLEKDLKIVPVNYYRNIWIPLGMGAFGLPLGSLLGLSLGNIGLMAIGLPIGVAIGAAFGAVLDKKAKKEGRQLNIEIKY